MAVVANCRSIDCARHVGRRRSLFPDRFSDPRHLSFVSIIQPLHPFRQLLFISLGVPARGLQILVPENLCQGNQIVAEAGDFPSAIESQQKAIALAMQDSDKEDMQSHLKLYEAGKPYRDEPKK